MVLESTAVRSDLFDPDEVYEPRTSVSGQSHKFVSFYVGETHYAMPAKDVAEVTGALTPTPLPDSPSRFLGIAPHRGDILGVITLEGSGSAGTAVKSKAIVLRPTISVEMPLAFNVDRLGELLQIRASDIYSTTSPDPNANLETTFEGHRVLIIEPARLVDLLVHT